MKSGKWLRSFTLAALCASLSWCALPALAEDHPRILVNGVQLAAHPTLIGTQLYFPGEELAKAMGASLQSTAGGYTLNGQPLRIPPMLLDGKPYLTLESAAQALGGTVVKDPVRGTITVTCSTQSVAGGVPYYSAEYRTPEQQQQEEREKMLREAGTPGEVWLNQKSKEMEKMYPKTLPHLNRVPTPIDFKIPAHPWVSNDETDPYGIPDGRPKAPPAVASAPPQGYATRLCENGVYKVTVSDVKVAEALRGINPDLVAPPGTKFVVVYLSEENQSKGQLPAAWFALRDAGGNQYVGDFGLSQFSRAPLRSRETTQGYVIFQIPVGAAPSALEVLCDPPLSMSLLMAP